MTVDPRILKGLRGCLWLLLGASILIGCAGSQKTSQSVIYGVCLVCGGLVVDSEAEVKAE